MKYKIILLGHCNIRLTISLSHMYVVLCAQLTKLLMIIFCDIVIH